MVYDSSRILLYKTCIKRCVWRLKLLGVMSRDIFKLFSAKKGYFRNLPFVLGNESFSYDILLLYLSS